MRLGAPGENIPKIGYIPNEGEEDGKPSPEFFIVYKNT